MVVYTDAFTRANSSNLGSIPNGGPAWEVVNGSWQILSNRIYTSTLRSQNPIAVVDVGSGNVQVSADISNGGGDAVYARVIDVDNWIRARIRVWESSTPRTEYEWRGTLTTTDGHNHTYTKWGTSSTLSPFVNSVNHSHDGGAYHVHSETQANSYYTGRTRQGSTTSTNRRVVLERCINGIVTGMGQYTISATRLSLRVNGSQVQLFINGATSPQITASVSSQAAATRHGVGRASSEYNGQAIDNFSIETLNTPPVAPGVTSPPDNLAVPLSDGIAFAWVHDDVDVQEGWALKRRLVNDDLSYGPEQWWQVGSGWGPSEVANPGTGSSVTITDWADDSATYQYAIATADLLGIGDYSDWRTLNPWEWWNGSAWVPVASIAPGVASTATLSGFDPEAHAYRWSVAVADEYGGLSRYPASALFFVGGFERWGSVFI